MSLRTHHPCPCLSCALLTLTLALDLARWSPSQVAELEAQQRTVAEELLSYVESTPILKEAVHAKRLEENPEWALVLGLGYNEGQRRNLIYQHLGKMLTELRRVTGGDALRAKQLADLLYLRAHAGVQRRQDNVTKIVEHRRDVAEGIVLSLRQFVHALHDAGGNGRYPDKVKKAQQVCISLYLTSVYPHLIIPRTCPLSTYTLPALFHRLSRPPLAAPPPSRGHAPQSPRLPTSSVSSGI